MSRYVGGVKRRLRLAWLAVATGGVVLRSDRDVAVASYRRRAERAEARAAVLQERTDLLKARLNESRAATKRKAAQLKEASRKTRGAQRHG